MTSLPDDFISGTPEEWVQGLPTYQRTILRTMLDRGISPEEAAVQWLSASINDTAPFGATSPSRLYFQKLLEEAEAFLCGDPKYESQRSTLAARAHPIKSIVVGSVAVALAPHLGGSEAVLAPPVELIVATIGTTAGHMGINAWCNMRRASRTQAVHGASASTQASSDYQPTRLALGDSMLINEPPASEQTGTLADVALESAADASGH